MFKVYIEENDTNYYVWGPNELVETKKIHDYSYSKVEDPDIIYTVMPSGKNLYAVIEHLNPQIISENDLFYHINYRLEETLKYPGASSRAKESYYEVKSMPCTPITEEEYRNLFEYAKKQGEFEHEDSIKTDLEIVSKTLKKEK